MKAKIIGVEVGLGEIFCFKLFLKSEIGNFEIQSDSKEFYKKLFYSLDIESADEFVGKTLNFKGEVVE